MTEARYRPATKPRSQGVWRTGPYPRVRAVVAAAGVGVVLAVSGCGGSSTTPPAATSTTRAPASSSAPATSPEQAPSVPGVDDRDSDAVMEWVARQLYSWRLGVDADASAGFERAKPLLTPHYIDEVGSTAIGLAHVTEATWERWADEHATVTATAHVTHDDHPADTPTTRNRVVAVTQHVSAVTGPAEPDKTIAVYTTATRVGDRWRVSMISPR